MKSSDLDRRKFLKQTATTGAVGVGMSATGLSAAALGNAEAEYWKSRVGSSFRHQGAELVLQSVDVTDRSADPARPRHLRAEEIAMLFVLKGGTVDALDRHRLDQGVESHEVHLTRVVAPQGEAGEFYEAIVN